jgi:predicted kinase
MRKIKMELILTVGNIGSGKSLLTSKFAKMGHAIVNMDSIQAMFSGGEYGMYDTAKKTVYQATEDTAVESALKCGLSVCVDRTNMDLKRRKRFIDVAKKYTDKIVCYDFGVGDLNCLSRRLKNPHGVSISKWTNVFEFMKNSYEKPLIEEGFSEIIEAPKRFRFFAFDFDGQIVKNKFPEIGEIIDGTVIKMNNLWEDLQNIIIISTCRSGDYENLAREFLIKNKIPFDFINENPVFETGSRKVFAHEYYDDRNKIC